MPWYERHNRGKSIILLKYYFANLVTKFFCKVFPAVLILLSYAKLVNIAANRSILAAKKITNMHLQPGL